MTRLGAIYRRELAYAFNSPVAYVVTTVFLVVAGYFFYNLLGYFNLAALKAMQNPMQAQQLSLTEAVVQPLFGNLSVILLLILPLLTMRLLCEERSSGTAELLFTFPISDWDAILGKFFATVTVYAVMLGMTALYPALLARYSTPEWGPILSGYLGLFLMGTAFIAMGLFFSSIGDNQMVAGVMSFGCGLLFLLLGWITPFVSSSASLVLAQLSILEHFTGFAQGIIDTNDLIYFANFIVFFLFLSARVLDSNRWRS
jgi:ABC-2 type transport system permease protein